jgi:hypothetical protein
LTLFIHLKENFINAVLMRGTVANIAASLSRNSHLWVSGRTKTLANQSAAIINLSFPPDHGPSKDFTGLHRNIDSWSN